MLYYLYFYSLEKLGIAKVLHITFYTEMSTYNVLEFYMTLL